MISTKQLAAAQQNILKAQAKWRSMTPRQRALAQPQGRNRLRPGAGGGGEYYHVEVRPKSEFTSFRIHDIGRKGHTKRVAGHRSSGSWATQKWLIHKDDAQVENGQLIIRDPDLFKSVRGPIVHKKGDIFRAKPLRNVPEKAKPTSAQKLAWTRNLEKAREALRMKRALQFYNPFLTLP